MLCPSCDHENIPGADLCEHCGLDLAGLDVEAWGVNPEDTLLTAPLGSLPVKPPITVAPDSTVAAAIDQMKQKHEGCVFVKDEEGTLVGVLTERDVTVRIAAPGRDPEATRVDEVMTPQPVTLHPSDPVAWALHRMGVDGFRHLPLIEHGKLAGFLSVRSVLQELFQTD